MAENPRQSEPIVNRFLEIIAAACLTAGANALISEKYPAVLIAVILFVAVACLRIEKLRDSLGEKFRRHLSSLANSGWVWLSVVGGSWLFIMISTFIFQHQDITSVRNELILIRADLNRYVMPRRLTKDQQSKIAGYLSQYPPQEIEIRVINNDEEASGYRTYLQPALEEGGWTVTLKRVDEAGEGLRLETRETDQTVQERRHPKAPPKPSEFLTQTLRKVGVMIDGSSGQHGGSSITKDSMALVIGHRRRDERGSLSR